MSLPPGSVKELVGDASTSEQLRACKIGGCCGKDTPLLPMEALLPRLDSLPDWNLSTDQKSIRRDFVARNWQSAINFVNAVSAIAEEEGHHVSCPSKNTRNEPSFKDLKTNVLTPHLFCYLFRSQTCT